MEALSTNLICLSFIDHPSMSVGLYELPASAVDRQFPYWSTVQYSLASFVLSIAIFELPGAVLPNAACSHAMAHAIGAGGH